MSGGFTVPEAQDLAKILNAGRLSVPAKIVQEQQVGPERAHACHSPLRRQTEIGTLLSGRGGTR